MDENIKAVRREKWRKIIMMQKGSGLTITEWCEQNGIRARQFHYWQKILRDNALLEMKPDQSSFEQTVPACVSSQETAVQVFAEVPLSQQSLSKNSPIDVVSDICGHESGVMLRFHDIQIHISETFSERALTSVLQVIRNA